MTDRDVHAELLAQIYAAPDDDTPRLVYADWLQQRGDPRGEFIALQIERARAKARKGGRQREDALLTDHDATWAAPLEPWMVRGADGNPDRPVVEFRRGFPAVVGANAINLDPSWSTVTHCNMPPHDDRCHVGALRVITAATADDIIALAKLTKPLAITELVWSSIHDFRRAGADPRIRVVPPAAIEAFSAIHVLPALRRFEIAPAILGHNARPAQCSWIWQAPLAASLDELLIPGDDLAGWIEALSATRLPTFELAMAADDPHGWQRGSRLIVERDARNTFGNVTARIARSTPIALETLTRQFEQLDRGVLSSVRVAIATNAELRRSARECEALARMLAARGIDATIERAER